MSGAGAAWAALRPGFDNSFLDWPFFEARHRDRAAGLADWLPGILHDEPHAEATVDEACRAHVRALRASLDSSLVDQLELEWDNQRITLASDDARAAIQALKDKSVPKFLGR